MAKQREAAEEAAVNILLTELLSLVWKAEIACNSTRVWCTLVVLSSLAAMLFQRERAELSLSNQGCSFTLHLMHCDCWECEQSPSITRSCSFPHSSFLSMWWLCGHRAKCFSFLIWGKTNLYLSLSLFFSPLFCEGCIFLRAANQANSTCSCMIQEPG